MTQSASALEQIRPFKQPLIQSCAELGLTNLRLFGSFARNEQRPDSDMDLLAHLPWNSGVSLLDLAKLQVQLGALCNRRVEIVLDDTLHPALRPDIIREAISL